MISRLIFDRYVSLSKHVNTTVTRPSILTSSLHNYIFSKKKMTTWKWWNERSRGHIIWCNMLYHPSRLNYYFSIALYKIRFHSVKFNLNTDACNWGGGEKERERKWFFNRIIHFRIFFFLNCQIYSIKISNFSHIIYLTEYPYSSLFFAYMYPS